MPVRNPLTKATYLPFRQQSDTVIQTASLQCPQPALTGCAKEGARGFPRRTRCSCHRTAPASVIRQVKDTGRLIGALCGKRKQALQHKAAGLDFMVAQGTEGGGHTGEIGSVVLCSDIIDAADPLPVLSAGGIGNGRQMLAAMSMGADGVWTGSLWLTVEEAHAQHAQKESSLAAVVDDTVRTRAWTGKPARVLRNAWTDAWDNPEAPDPLPMPLHGLVSADAMRRTQTYAGAGDTQAVAMNICGQVIGQINQVESCRDVVFRLMTEYVDALERLNRLTPDA